MREAGPRVAQSARESLATMVPRSYFSCCSGYRKIVFVCHDSLPSFAIRWQSPTAVIVPQMATVRGNSPARIRDETITLGTLMVEEYERPKWTFNRWLARARRSGCGLYASIGAHTWRSRLVTRAGRWPRKARSSVIEISAMTQAARSRQNQPVSPGQLGSALRLQYHQDTCAKVRPLRG
jgi:hypothetical protein